MASKGDADALPEENCVGITFERKYFRVDDTFIKRSLRPSEWKYSPISECIYVPPMGPERLVNEAAAMRFVEQNTNIPVPRLHACYVDAGAVILVMEYIEGVSMTELDSAQRQIVTKELELHLETMHNLRSGRLGGPSGIVVPPYRLMHKSRQTEWKLHSSSQKEFVFCHNDLSQHNVIVDPKTLKIAAILDWEYAGFFPAWFEKRIFERAGPSVAVNGEEDDTQQLLDFLKAYEVSAVDGEL